MKRIPLALVGLLIPVLSAQAQPTANAWINELHYDNDGGDANEFVEIVIEDAGSYALNDISVVLYNGNDNASYDSETVDDLVAGTPSGDFSIYTWSVAGIQNGAPDGVALCYQGAPIQFLSYEGSITASGGCAGGETSTDIGVNEGSSTLDTESLQLMGSGASYADFTWTGPTTASAGRVNASQTLQGLPVINVTQGTRYAAIQAALDAANANDVIEVADGAYTESLSITTDGLSISGASESGVVVNTEAAGYGVFIAADGVTLESMTINGPTDDAASSYGIKAQGETTLPEGTEDRMDGLTLRNLTVQGSGRSEIDLNGVDDATLEELTANGNNTAGVGLALTDCNSATISGLSTSGNDWGGAAIFVKGEFFSLGSDGVAFTGTNSFGETLAAYVEASGSAMLADVTNLTVPSEMVYGGTFVGTEATFAGGFTSRSNALSFAVASPNPQLAYVTELASGDFYVADGMSIQAAIDGGSNATSLLGVPFGTTINVLPGTFEEQLELDRDGLTISGAGNESDPSTSTIIRSPATLSYSFATSSEDNYPIVGVHDATGVTLQNVRVDGAGRGNGNYRFVGVGFWNAGGSIENSVITGVRETPLSGTQHGVGIYASNDTGGPYAVSITGTTLDDFQKNGMALTGDGLTVNVEDNTVTGAGVTDVIGQNGIQMGYGATGSITQNEVSGLAYNGATYAAAGILVLLADAGTVVSTNTVEGSQVSLWFYSNSAEVTGNSVTSPAAVGIGTWGAILDPVSAPSPTPFGEPKDGAKTFQKASASNSYIFNENALLGEGADTSTGLEIYSGSESVSVEGTGNLIKEFDTGVYVGEAAEGGVDSVVLHQNCIVDNETVGLANTAALTVDATSNWWGNGAGPGAPNANGIDGPVTVRPVAEGPVATVTGCGGGSAECEASDFVETVVSNEPPGQVRLEIDDPEGIQGFGFVEPQVENPDPTNPDHWAPFLNNFDAAHTASTGSGLVDASFDARVPQPGLVWVAADVDDPPTNARFELIQADVENPAASYYGAVLNGCGTLTLIDPLHTLEAPPETFALMGNYPNPFHTQTTLQFALPEAADVTLSVYDVMGRKVATLVDAPMPAGTHEVVWNGLADRSRKLVSGIYFYRLEAGNITRVKRMALIR